ncbi:hypothetical protein BC828DRAFT_379594 [Blastocladiella britannica]|nr:hypothetical protein BC828DRAFT_379594 [Blastocladiella britannica]
MAAYYVAYSWTATIISLAAVALDLHMLAIHTLAWRRFCRRSSPRRRKGRKTRLIHILAWLCFLSADLCEVGFMGAYATQDECGGFPTFHSADGPNALIRQFWVESCPIYPLRAAYEALAFFPLPLYPIIFMRLVLQLQQLYSRRMKRAVILCASGILLAMVVQELSAIFVFYAFHTSVGSPLFLLMYQIHSLSYLVHVGLVMLMGAVGVAFFLRFHRMVTARLAPRAIVHEDMHIVAVGDPVGTKHEHEHLDHQQKFKHAVSFLHRAALLNAAMLGLVLCASVVAIVTITGSILSSAFVTLFGRLFLASFSLTIRNMRPLMLLRRQLPTVDAGTLATEWSGGLHSGHDEDHHRPETATRKGSLQVITLARSSS